MEESALEVLERLIMEDDSSVEAWYLGGWCLFLLSGKQQKSTGQSKGQGGTEADVDDKRSRVASRCWLWNSLKLYETLQYEDARLRQHAQELVNELDNELGMSEEDEESDGEEGWDDDDDFENGESDEEMGDP